MKNKKQAILIMANKNNYVLEKNIELLDSPLVDIFILVDKKFKNFDFKYYEALVKKSNLVYVEPRINIYWGGFSLIEAELNLLKVAFNYNDYEYFHLISGQDMLLQPINRFTQIFNDNRIYIDSIPVIPDNKENKKIYKRIAVNHFMVNHIRDSNKLVQFFARVINRVGADLQFIFGRDFIKENNIDLYYGSNWFSIPNDVVKFILNQKDIIKDYFSKGWLVDELFIQTIIQMDSKFKRRIASGNKREILFVEPNTDHPYIWKESDYKKLKNSNKVFARKFDEKVDKKIIDKIYTLVKQRNKN